MSEIGQSDISTLFARDPLSLTKEDRRPMIEYYRANRAKFLAGQSQAKLPKEAKQKSKGPLPDIDVDLGDLKL